MAAEAPPVVVATGGASDYDLAYQQGAPALDATMPGALSSGAGERRATDRSVFNFFLGALGLGQWCVIGAHPSKSCYIFIISFWFLLWIVFVMTSGKHGWDLTVPQIHDLLGVARSFDINQTGDMRKKWLVWDSYRLLSDLAKWAHPTIDGATQVINRGVAFGKLNDLLRVLRFRADLMRSTGYVSQATIAGMARDGTPINASLLGLTAASMWGAFFRSP